MDSMFEGCSSLSSLNLSNFDTSKVISMNNMFYLCDALISLDVSNFNTSKVTSMYSMFYDCNLLISLNLSSFDTSKVNLMDEMFYNCNSLTSLNLSNFDTSQVESISYIFYNCSKLEYLNIKNFVVKEETIYEDMFFNFPMNIVICAEEENVVEILKAINGCLIISCSDDWQKENLNLGNNGCMENFSEKPDETILNIDHNTEKNIEEIYGIVTSKNTEIFISGIEESLSINDKSDKIINNQCNFTYELNEKGELILNNILNDLNFNISKEAIEGYCIIVFKEKYTKLTLSKIIINDAGIIRKIIT